jgi:diamine N-acetyltransferase
MEVAYGPMRVRAAKGRGKRMHLEFKEITRDNWEQCIRLRVPPTQTKYLPSNVYALAESKFLTDRVPLAVYDGRTMIGMVTCSYAPEIGRAWIHRLMIADSFRNKGYTHAALRKLLHRLRKLPGVGVIGADYRPDNQILARVFDHFGFHVTGQVTASGDTVACLKVEPESAGGPVPVQHHPELPKSLGVQMLGDLVNLDEEAEPAKR